MTIDIKKDLEIIEAATDGPWFSTEDWNGATFVNVDSDAEPTVAETMGGTKGADMDAEYIAHFNPSYCKELVTALKESEADREKLDKSLREVFKAWQECYSQFERPALFERVKELLER